MTTHPTNRLAVLGLLTMALVVGSCCEERASQWNCTTTPIAGTRLMAVECRTVVIAGTDTTEVTASDTIPDPNQ